MYTACVVHNEDRGSFDCFFYTASMMRSELTSASHIAWIVSTHQRMSSRIEDELRCLESAARLVDSNVLVR